MILSTHTRRLPGSPLCLLLSLAACLSQAAQPQPPAVPDFTVEAPIDGRTFRLSENRGRWVAIHFLLKTECPYCLRHTQTYATNAPSDGSVVHLFLKPDSAGEIKAWAAKLGEQASQIPVYRDPDAQLARQLRIPDGYAFHGETVHYPALVLLDPDGREVFRHVGRSNADRVPYPVFAAKLAELRRVPAPRLEEYNLGPDRLALQGYDPVSYFTGPKPQKGRKEFSTQHRGVTYFFASEEHRKLFNADPAKYEPTYGGWCATAMAKGEKVEIDPANFKITNGRLFLFFKAFYANALKEWNRDEANLTAKADAHWHRLSGEP